MATTNKQRRIWIGYSLLSIAILHTVYAFVFFGGIYTILLRQGLFDTVNQDALKGAAVWFLLFGVLLALLGIAVHALEKSPYFHGARALGAGIFALSLLGVILMPASGFWLAFPPALALLMTRSSAV
ncbi:DUF6463 family protein [Undibacterium sp. TS12]|uniref:DUF6463 family protein n=1 Tax=Undibacterium sp. TS12 TaxID=2908202 RepID=UPI001F4D1730|nr:DUF6463 family protein [Undibacterium sp. TS12]MCH8619705.1 DUF6463 family protein [Undibacterium sp. TS12]